MTCIIVQVIFGLVPVLSSDHKLEHNCEKFFHVESTTRESKVQSGVVMVFVVLKTDFTYKRNCTSCTVTPGV